MARSGRARPRGGEGGGGVTTVVACLLVAWIAYAVAHARGHAAGRAAEARDCRALVDQERAAARDAQAAMEMSG